MKIDILERAVSNSYQIYEKENFELRRRTEFLEQKLLNIGCNSCNYWGSNSSDQNFWSCNSRGPSNYNSANFSQEDEQNLKRKFEKIVDFWIQKSESDDDD